MSICGRRFRRPVGHSPQATTTTVRVRSGVTTPTDGPFIEAKEHLAGYYVVACDSLERAVELAAQIPDAAINAVEVRPIVAVPGMEV